jgi:predicted ATPase
MIKINTIPETTCELFLDGKLIGTIDNSLSLYDVRVQIMKEKAVGYYIKWQDKILYINENGKLDEWPKGFFDGFDTYLILLLKI